MNKFHGFFFFWKILKKIREIDLFDFTSFFDHHVIILPFYRLQTIIINTINIHIFPIMLSMQTVRLGKWQNFVLNQYYLCLWGHGITTITMSNLNHSLHSSLRPNNNNSLMEWGYLCRWLKSNLTIRGK